MWLSILPSILLPTFSWHRHEPIRVSASTPPTPPNPGRMSLIVWGYVHHLLEHISIAYCQWLDVSREGSVFPLPFGLILKWSERTRLEEFIAMKMARAAGIPAPIALSCGEHPGHHFPTSILMTRLPGWELCNSREPLEVEEEGPWLSELRQCLEAMRMWKNPFGKAICSVLGSSISSCRVPRHNMGPFDKEDELMDYLLAPASTRDFDSPEQYDDKLKLAKRLSEKPHRVVFTHGDFETHNILVDSSGHLSGFIDWECAGWYPEYWEYTSTMRWGTGTWWWLVASHLGGETYLDELVSDKAVHALTVDSYIGM